jgi:hypothetical protein
MSGYPTYQALERDDPNNHGQSKATSLEPDRLLQFRKFCLGLLQDGDVRVAQHNPDW